MDEPIVLYVIVASYDFGGDDEEYELIAAFTDGRIADDVLTRLLDVQSATIGTGLAFAARHRSAKAPSRGGS